MIVGRGRGLNAHRSDRLNPTVGVFTVVDSNCMEADTTSSAACPSPNIHRSGVGCDTLPYV